MADPNGWPDASKPGYPPNPHEDGWYWIDKGDYVVPMHWLNGANTWFGPASVASHKTAVKRNWRYLGPVYTQTDMDALSAEIDRLHRILHLIAHADEQAEDFEDLVRKIARENCT